MGGEGNPSVCSGFKTISFSQFHQGEEGQKLHCALIPQPLSQVWETFEEPEPEKVVHNCFVNVAHLATKH